MRNRRRRANLFAALTDFHQKFNVWGGKPSVKETSRKTAPDGESVKVKYRVVQYDKFGDEHGEGSDWEWSTVIEHHKSGKWETGLQMTRTMKY